MSASEAYYQLEFLNHLRNDGTQRIIFEFTLSNTCVRREEILKLGVTKVCVFNPT